MLARSTVTKDPEELSEAAQAGATLWGFAATAGGVRQGRAYFEDVGRTRPISDPPAIVEQSKAGNRPAALPPPKSLGASAGTEGGPAVPIGPKSATRGSAP